ncbi:hypothetical protein MTO96_011185 [Rhipicephalus appendiculatus]
MATSTLGESILNFSVDLYKQLMPKERQNGNIFFSPFSISAALSMALGGARSNTAKELSTVLHVDADHVHEEFSSYQSLLRDNYNASIESVDFRNQYENVRQEVNTWVEKATESKIKDLLPSGSVDAMTTLILVNAIYFKGLWCTRFNPTHTRPADFHLDSKNKIQVQMMYRKSSYSMSYSDELRASALELPYHGRKTSMVVLLPSDVEGLSKLEERLTASALSEVIDEPVQSLQRQALFAEIQARA